MVSAAFYVLGALSSILFRRNGGRKLNFLFCAAGALSGVLLAASVIAGGSNVLISLPQLLPFSGFSFLIDPLSAVFVGIISIVAFPVSLYSVGYAREYASRKNCWLLGFAQNLFILSMVLVVSANNALLFLIVWEVMSLLSYFLVNFEGEKPESNRAGFVYLVMTHAGTAFIILSFLILFHFSGSFGFDSFRALGGMPSFYKSLAFVFALIGFGTKAGIIPLHIWLPRAHPAAPSNISALMSGVMIKTAIYALIRVVFEFLGGGFLWWGLVILGLGTVSAVLGVLYAIAEHDLKRLLAYHSVENIGIILMGVGASIVFASFGSYFLASIALMAGLFHTLNHALFKSLLFLGAGSVLHSTHTKNMEDLGGIIKRMPWTALFFLVGAVSISALPLFNGFVSEWLVFQSLLAGAGSPSLVVKIILPLSGAMLALTGGLAALCFVKAFGITFLGNPRSHHAEHAKEAPFSMKFGMGFLALLCFLLGIFPVLAVSSIDPVSAQFWGLRILPSISSFSGVVISPFGSGAISPLILLLVFVSAIPLAGAVISFFGGKASSRKYGTWDCGFVGLGARHQYTATAYAQPARAVFSGAYDQKEEINREAGMVSSYSLELGSLFENYLYAPAASAILRAATLLQRIQTGSTRTYLIYIFAALLVLLAAMRWL